MASLEAHGSSRLVFTANKLEPGITITRARPQPIPIRLGMRCSPAALRVAKVLTRSGLTQRAHRRSVRWSARLSRDEFTQGALYELGSTLALFEVKSYSDEFLRRFEAGAAPAEDDIEENVVRDIAETTER